MVFSTLAALVLLVAPCASLTPIIVIPGLTSSTIQYRMQNADAINPHCFNSTIFGTWQQLWPLTLPEVVSADQVECTIYHMRITYNATTDTFSEPPGITTRVPDFGSFQNVLSVKGSQFWAYLLGNFTTAGWTQDKNLFFAPFDWRQLGSRMTDFHSSLKTLVEQVYNSNGQKRVALVAVSEGPQITLAFLQAMTLAWRTQYIEWFVAQSPVWGGSSLMYLTLTAGVNLTANMSPEIGRRIITGAPGVMWLMPRAGTDPTNTWTDKEPICFTPSKNYTAFDYVQLATDAGLGAFVPELTVIENDPVLHDFQNPGVNTFVTYGYEVPTVASVTYDVDLDPTNATLPFPSNLTQTSGDSLVPLRSSLRSLTWQANMTAAGLKFVQKGFAGQIHADCMFDSTSECFMDIVRLLANGTLPQP